MVEHGLLHQELVAEGVLRERGARPPVLPVVIYNGRSPWTAPANVSALIALETNRDGSRLPALEVRTMLADTVQEWTAQWVEQGRAEERALLCRQAARKFDAAAGQQLATVLADVTDPDRSSLPLP